MLNISYECVHHIHVTLDMRKKSAKFITKYLKIVQKHARVKISLSRRYPGRQNRQFPPVENIRKFSGYKGLNKHVLTG